MERPTAAVRTAAETAFAACGCRDYARVDFMISSEGEPFLLEINTLPGMKETSLLPMSARCAGLDFTALVREMVRPAVERFRSGVGIPPSMSKDTHRLARDPQLEGNPPAGEAARHVARRAGDGWRWAPCAPPSALSWSAAVAWGAWEIGAGAAARIPRPCPSAAKVRPDPQPRPRDRRRPRPGLAGADPGDSCRRHPDGPRPRCGCGPEVLADPQVGLGRDRSAIFPTP